MHTSNPSGTERNTKSCNSFYSSPTQPDEYALPPPPPPLYTNRSHPSGTEHNTSKFTLQGNNGFSSPTQPDEYAEVLSRLYYVSNGKDLDEDKLKGLVTKFIPNTLLYEQSDEELVQLAKEKFGEVRTQ